MGVFARDADACGFLAMAGFHTMLSAIWASLHKTPPDATDCLTDAVGLARSGGYRRRVRRTGTCGTRTGPPWVVQYALQRRWALRLGLSVKGQLLALNHQHWGRVEPLVEQAWAAPETGPVYDPAEQIVAILGLQGSVPAAMLPLPGITHGRDDQLPRLAVSGADATPSVGHLAPPGPLMRNAEPLDLPPLMHTLE